jgi:hypothetical protein
LNARKASLVGIAPATAGTSKPAVADAAERFTIADEPAVNVCVAYVKSPLPVVGALPAPAPTTKAFVAKTPEVPTTNVLEAYRTPPAVKPLDAG